MYPDGVGVLGGTVALPVGLVVHSDGGNQNCGVELE